MLVNIPNGITPSVRSKSAWKARILCGGRASEGCRPSVISRLSLGYKGRLRPVSAPSV